jgi:membrane protease YdiL (CAAX protease family)
VRAIQATALVFVGSAIALIVAGVVWYATNGIIGLTVWVALVAGLGATALAILPPQDPADPAIHRRLRPRHFIEAVAVGVGGVAISFAYVFALVALLEDAGTEPAEEGGIEFLLGALLIAPILEEWMCRGVLWRALRPFAGANGTIVACALLFGFLHFGDGWLLAFPHRIVVGLGLGWLRERSGSLLPPIAAHFTLNAIVVAVESLPIG